MLPSIEILKKAQFIWAFLRFKLRSFGTDHRPILHFTWLTVTLSLVSGCTTLAISPAVTVSGWIRSSTPVQTEGYRFQLRLMGEDEQGRSFKLREQKLNVRGLPVQYAMQARPQNPWVNYWLEVRWRKEENVDWQILRYPLPSSEGQQALDIDLARKP